jgi:hypothetical protein
MSEQERVFQQFHYSSAASVMGAGNTHGWGVVSSSQMDDGRMNEEITNSMVSEYPIVEGREYTEYMVYVSKYQTFITIGLSNTDSINNGRDSRFAHIFMPILGQDAKRFYEHPENFIPNLDWKYEKDIQSQKHLDVKKDEFIKVDLALLIKKLGFRTDKELACFIQQVYLSLFKNAQVLYICNPNFSELEFRKQAKDFAILLLAMIPSKFYRGKSIAFFADSDIKSTSFVFRTSSDSDNQWIVGKNRRLESRGYEEVFYLDMARKMMAHDAGNSFRQLKEQMNARLQREDYDSFFATYYEILVENNQNISIEDWKSQYIDGILYDVGYGKYWKLSVYLMTHLDTLKYPTKKVKNWYQKWLKVAENNKEAKEKVEQYLQITNPLLAKELFLSKEESTKKAVEWKTTSTRTDNRSLEEIRAEIDKLLMKVITQEAEELLTKDLLTLYGRIVKKQGDIKKAEKHLMTVFEILKESNPLIVSHILYSIRQKYKGYDKEVLSKLVDNFYEIPHTPHVYMQVKKEEVKEKEPPVKKKQQKKWWRIGVIVGVVTIGAICSVFAVKNIMKDTTPTAPSTSIQQTSQTSQPSSAEQPTTESSQEEEESSLESSKSNGSN